MKQTIDYSLFEQAFENFNRVGQGKDFSYTGLKLLFEYLEDYEESTGEELELDPIALCCAYAELTDAEAKQDYGKSLKELEEKTLVIWVDKETAIIDVNF